MSVGPDSLSVCRSRNHAPGHRPPPRCWPTRWRWSASSAETLWSARSDDELVDTVGQVQQLVAAAAAVEAGAVAEADARDLAKQQLAYGSTGDWLTHLAGLRRGEGKQRVGPGQGAVRPAVADPGGAGGRRCSPDQADVIVAAVADLPPQEWTRRRGRS